MTVTDDLQAGARWAPALRALGDERLARMVESGSDPAFTAIYGRYAPILHGYCRSLLRDEDEAGDALQNAMLKALQAMRRAGRTGPLRPWLFRIAHNESISIIRSRTRRPGPLDESIPDPNHPADDAFNRAVARERLAALLEDLEHLSEQQRGALVMRELGGLTYDEISEALDTTPLAARQAVFVAKKRLSNPRRLRPALRQLIPAPAGFALWGLLGGTGGKALIGAAAAVSVGVGSVELAVQAPTQKPKAKTVAAATPHKRGRVTAKATATPSAQRRSRPAATPAPAPVRRTAHAATTHATFTEVVARATPTPEAAEPEPTAAPEQHESARRPEHEANKQVAAAPTQTPPPPQHQQQRPTRPVEGSTARARGDCPKGQQPTTGADEASAGGAAVQPVQ
jgi:RNA polymerase sigma factor (sigma-70 family)